MTPDHGDTIFKVGSWHFGLVPVGWTIVKGAGLRCSDEGRFPSTAVASEDSLEEGVTLDDYVKNQTTHVQRVISAPIFSSRAVSFRGSDEASALDIRFSAQDGRKVIQRQVYARLGRRVGVLTFTTLVSEATRVQSVFDNIASRTFFRPEPDSSP